MLYEPIEIEVSAKYLEKVFSEIKGDVCLIGGWATFHTVNKNFENINGRKYIGSRDIDIGFHIDKGWSKEQLKRSEFSATIGLIEDVGFRPVSFRFVKDFDSETGRELTAKESARLPLFQIFQLYVDLYNFPARGEEASSRLLEVVLREWQQNKEAKQHV